MNGVLGTGRKRLPEELMSDIFSMCLEPDDIGCVTPSSTAAPLTISWVCRLWRRLCLSTPRLWTGIDLQDLTQDGLYAKDRVALLSLLDLWISRSASCPISVKFSYVELSDDERGDMLLFLPDHNEDSAYVRDVNSLMDKLLSCQHRWRALDMAVLDLSVVEPLLEAVSSRPASPLLEHLSVSTQYLGIFGEIRAYNLALSPQLRTIRILSPLIVPEVNGVQFNQLKELDLKYCSSMLGCLHWIDKAPNIGTFKVRFFGAEGFQLEGETRPRKMGKLADLQVSSFSSDSDPAPFLNLLELPALVDLFVDANDLIDFQHWTCILDMLRRSRPFGLESLTLLGTPMNSEDILESLRMSPKLTYLNLGITTDDILHALSASTPRYPRSEAPLCPLLEALEIADVDGCSSESLINIASSRCKDDPCARTPDQSGSTAPSIQSGSQYKTLSTLIIPHDPDYAFINHPDVVECLEKGLNVMHRAPAFDILPPSRVSIQMRQVQ